MPISSVTPEIFEVNDLLSQLRSFFLQKHPDKQKQIQTVFQVLLALNK